MSSKTFIVKLELLENYLFKIDFGDGGLIYSDEPEPLGNSEGPSPSDMLAAATANCLAASLLFALRKHKINAQDVSAEVTGNIDRIDERLRIPAMDVNIRINSELNTNEAVKDALSKFEDFCIVTQSVREGIAVSVNVLDSNHKTIHSNTQ